MTTTPSQNENCPNSVLQHASSQNKITPKLVLSRPLHSSIVNLWKSVFPRPHHSPKIEMVENLSFQDHPPKVKNYPKPAHKRSSQPSKVKIVINQSFKSTLPFLSKKNPTLVISRQTPSQSDITWNQSLQDHHISKSEFSTISALKTMTSSQCENYQKIQSF